MNRTPQETQAWHDQQVARFATPDGTVETIGGRDWARIRPMMCATACGNYFYGWQPVDAVYEPWTMDEAPGQRQTCGHPLCHKAEEDRSFRAGHNPANISR